MFLVDSSVWIAYFNGISSPQTDRLDAALGWEPVLVGDLMLTEVLQGFRSDRDFRLAKRLMLSLDVVNLLGKVVAVQAAENYRVLRRKGATVRKTTDCVIATWCIENGVALLHDDRDFEWFEQYLGLEAV